MNDTSEAGNWPYDLEVCFDFYTGGTNIKKKKKKLLGFLGTFTSNFTSSRTSALGRVLPDC